MFNFGLPSIFFKVVSFLEIHLKKVIGQDCVYSKTIIPKLI